MLFSTRVVIKKLTLALAICAVFSTISSCSQSPDAKLEVAVAEAIAKLPKKPEFPSLNAEMLRALSADFTALRPKLAELERSEKKNLARAATLMDTWGSEGEAEDKLRPQASFIVPKSSSNPGKIQPFDWIIPSAHADDGSNLLASLSGFSSGMSMASMIGTGSGGEAGSATQSINGENGEKVTVTKTALADGTVTISLESNVDVAPLGVVGGTKTKIASKTFCPDANGRVEFTITMEQEATAKGLGSLARQSGVYEAVVEVITDDNGGVASTVMKTKYDRQSSGKGGTSKASGTAAWSTLGNDVTLNDRADGAVNGSAGEAHKSSAATAAAVLGQAAAQGASIYWQSNNCIRFDADIPGQVKPNANTDMQVKVVHKQDGSSVAARVEIKLEGGKTLTPDSIQRAPGMLSHVAPAEKGVQMSIELTARSRRGSAFQRYFIRTVDACYNIDGGGGEFVGNGSTCDIAQPFTVEGNANIKVDFTPTDANGGTYSYTGNVSGAKLSGKGTYKVQYSGDVPIGIIASGPGKACTPMGCFSSPGSEKYKLTPQS